MVSDEEKAQHDLNVLHAYARSKMDTEPETTMGVCMHARHKAVDHDWMIEKFCVDCDHRWMSVREPGASKDPHDMY